MLKGEPALAPSALVVAAGLGDKLLVVWGAGERGGLRLRLAAPAQIGTSPDVIVFDNLIEDGKVQGTSTLRDLRLLSGSGFAILLLSTKIGVHALRIEPDGKLELVRFQWAS